VLPWKPEVPEDEEALPEWWNDDAERYARYQEFQAKQDEWNRQYKPWVLIEQDAGGPGYNVLWGDPDTVCIWCGEQCLTLEKLEEHEDACAPEL
jgi:hypothetical protein